VSAPDRFEIVDPDQAFGSLAGAWDELLAASGSDSPFLTPTWLAAWWTAYGTGRIPAIVAAWRGTSLAGLVPLQLAAVEWRGGIPLRALRFLGDGTYDSDYLGPIVPREEEAEFLPAFWSWLRHASTIRYEVAHLNEIPVESPSYAPFRALLEEDGSLLEEDRVGCVQAPLPETYDAYVAGLKPRMRTKLRSLRRTLEGDHQAVLRRADAATLRESLESLFRLHQARWQARGEPGVFGTPEKRGFYHRVAAALLERGWLDLTTLVADGAPVAHQCCIRYRGTAYLLQEGYDPAWEERGVGNALRAMSIEAMIADRIRVYDFLAGVTEHKLSWGGATKESARLTLRGSGPYAALATGMRKLAAARAKLRSVISKSGQ